MNYYVLTVPARPVLDETRHHMVRLQVIKNLFLAPAARDAANPELQMRRHADGGRKVDGEGRVGSARNTASIMRSR